MKHIKTESKQEQNQRQKWQFFVNEQLFPLKIGTKTKYFSYYRCVCFLLLFIWNFNCNRYWLYKHNIISSPNFYNSILWYDKWTNRYHTKPCFICSFGLFLTITV